MECNRPDQVSFAPGKLRARAPILCPRLGCTYLKQTPLCDGPSQNIFVLWPAPEAFFSFFRALRRTRQTATNECISSCKSSSKSALDGYPFIRIGRPRTGASHGINMAKRTISIRFHHVQSGFRTARSRRSCPSQLADGRPRLRRPRQGAMGCHWRRLL